MEGKCSSIYCHAQPVQPVSAVALALALPEIPSSVASSSDKSSELCRDKSEQPIIKSKIRKSNSNSGAKRRAMASRRSATVYTQA